MTPLRRRLMWLVAGVSALVLVGFAFERTDRQFDLTAERSLTLSDETREVVRRVGRRVDITAFIERSAGGRAEASALLTRYRRLNRHIRFRVVDPNDLPGEARRLGVDPVLGGLALAQGDRVERASTATEQDITAGLARLLRQRTPAVCAVGGHGEASVDSDLGDGLSRASAVLGRNGYGVRVADLLASPALPSGCDAVVLASPQVDLGPAQDVLARYLASGGKALVLVDPRAALDLSPLLNSYGLAVDRGIVFEGDPGARLAGDPTTPIVRSYRGGTPIGRRLPPTFFPLAEGLVVSERARSGLAAAALAVTTPLAYLERQPREPAFDPASDRQGPIVLAATADYSEAGGPGEPGLRTRLVVVADLDFATNAFVDEAGNALFLVRALDWLTLDEDLVSVSTHVPRARPLDLTDARLRYARFLTAGIIPGFFLLAGAGVWAARRSR